MRSTPDTPDLQDCLRDSFRAGADRVGVSVRSQILLLSHEERSRYEESESRSCSNCCDACIDNSSLGVTQDGNSECVQDDVRGLSNNSKEGTPEGSGRFKRGSAVRKEASSGDFRRWKNEHGCPGKSDDKCGLSVASREGHEVRDRWPTWNDEVSGDMYG